MECNTELCLVASTFPEFMLVVTEDAIGLRVAHDATVHDMFQNLVCYRCQRDWSIVLSLQCYSVLSDILVKNELCIPLESGSNVLSTGEGFICLSPHSKLKIAMLFCSIYKKTISFSAIVF